MSTRRAARSLPGTLWARLRDSFTLLGALAHRCVAVLGLRSLDYAFTHETPQGQRQLRKPILLFVRLGYWMLGDITPGKWSSTERAAKPTSKLH